MSLSVTLDTNLKSSLDLIKIPSPHQQSRRFDWTTEYAAVLGRYGVRKKFLIYTLRKEQGSTELLLFPGCPSFVPVRRHRAQVHVSAAEDTRDSSSHILSDWSRTVSQQGFLCEQRNPLSRRKYNKVKFSRYKISKKIWGSRVSQENRG